MYVQGREPLVEWALSLFVGSRLWAQVIRLGGMCPHHLCRLASLLHASFYFPFPNTLFSPSDVDPPPSQTSLPTTYIPTLSSLINYYKNTLMFHWFIYFVSSCWSEPFSLISGSSSLVQLCFHHSAQDSTSEIHCVNVKQADLPETPLSPLEFVKFSGWTVEYSVCLNITKWDLSPLCVVDLITVRVSV